MCNKAERAFFLLGVKVVEDAVGNALDRLFGVEEVDELGSPLEFEERLLDGVNITLRGDPLQGRCLPTLGVAGEGDAGGDGGSVP